jgi:hypothetical protein
LVPCLVGEQATAPVTPCPAMPTPWSPHGEAEGEAGGAEVADSGVEAGGFGVGGVVVGYAGVIPRPTMAIHPIDAYYRVE